jgi:hypothetical protein
MKFKITVFLGLYNLVDVYQHFGGICYLHRHMEAAGSSETLVTINGTTRRSNPQDHNLSVPFV